MYVFKGFCMCKGLFLFDIFIVVSYNYNARSGMKGRIYHVIGDCPGSVRKLTGRLHGDIQILSGRLCFIYKI